MNRAWFYLHNDVVCGPFSEAELRKRAAQGLILEKDWIWQEGTERKYAVPAAAALDFSGRSVPVAPVPDWLADVAAAQRQGPLPGPEPTDAVRDWLEDLRLWVALDRSTPGQQAAAATAKSGLSSPVPDWLGSWLPVEQSKPPVPDPVQPGTVAPAMPSGSYAAPPVKPPISAVPAAATSAPGAEALAAILEASGFDPETGRVLDPERFRKWKQQAHAGLSAGPAASILPLLEAFRKARTAVEHWVDDERNRDAVLTADLEAVQRRPEIVALLDEYAGYGAEMGVKLRRHLAFMMKNRRNYYQALAQRG